MDTKDAPSVPSTAKLAAYLASVEKARQSRLAEWTKALDLADGNITRAADSLGRSKRYAMAVMGEFKLREYAAELRLAADGKRFGRPKE